MDGFGGGPPFMRDDGPDGMPRRGDHGPPMMQHSLPGDMPKMLGHFEHLSGFCRLHSAARIPQTCD